MEHWIGRRSDIYSTGGMCASSQPLASAVGTKILEKGGSAADACVAMAAVLNLTEPCSTGIGGDAFALYFDAKTKQVHSLQGNGRSSAKTTLESLNARGFGIGEGLKPWEPRSGLCVTVPGAAHLWETLVKTFGKMELKEVLQPAIKLAEDGFPIHPVTAKHWSEGYLQGEEAHRVLRPNNKPVQPGQLFRNPDLANTFRLLGEHGAKKGFYSGIIAEAIVQAVQEYGGDLSLDDLLHHETLQEAPISTVYKGIRVYQTPPPSHGLAVLLTLNLITQLEASTTSLSYPIQQKDEEEYLRFAKQTLTVEQVHHNLLAMRHGFADALQYITDPLHPTYQATTCPMDILLSEGYTKQRLESILATDKNGGQAVYPGDLTPFITGETVYFCCIDAEGNACSMINSNYMGFGTGIMPAKTGFTLHNRGYNFSLQPKHANQIQPNKRPYHTIIPGLATYEEDGNLYGVFGNMGGFMQPMGHVQLLRHLLDGYYSPQQAVDAPRWYLSPVGDTQSAQDLLTNEIWFEEGYDEKVKEALQKLGHCIPKENITGHARVLFGKAQVILRHPITGVCVAGSDPRSDGCAMPALLQ